MLRGVNMRNACACAPTPDTVTRLMLTGVPAVDALVLPASFTCVPGNAMENVPLLVSGEHLPCLYNPGGHLGGAVLAWTEVTPIGMTKAETTVHAASNLLIFSPSSPFHSCLCA